MKRNNFAMNFLIEIIRTTDDFFYNFPTFLTTTKEYLYGNFALTFALFDSIQEILFQLLQLPLG